MLICICTLIWAYEYSSAYLLGFLEFGACNADGRGVQAVSVSVHLLLQSVQYLAWLQHAEECSRYNLKSEL